MPKKPELPKEPVGKEPKIEPETIPENPPETAPDEVLLKLLGSQQAVDEFKRFRDKDNQRKVRKEIEYKVEDILADQLKAENDAAIEKLNKVYRRAWTLACKELKFLEEEFPSKY